MLLSFRVTDELGSRLEALTQKTHRSKSFYIKEALVNYMDDLEDIYMVEKRLNDLKKGRDSVLAGEEFWHGVED